MAAFYSSQCLACGGSKIYYRGAWIGKPIREGLGKLLNVGVIRHTLSNVLVEFGRDVLVKYLVALSRNNFVVCIQFHTRRPSVKIRDSKAF